MKASIVSVPSIQDTVLLRMQQNWKILAIGHGSATRPYVQFLYARNGTIDQHTEIATSAVISLEQRQLIKSSSMRAIGRFFLVRSGFALTTAGIKMARAISILLASVETDKPLVWGFSTHLNLRPARVIVEDKGYILVDRDIFIPGLVQDNLVFRGSNELPRTPAAAVAKLAEYTEQHASENARNTAIRRSRVWQAHAMACAYQGGNDTCATRNEEEKEEEGPA